MSEIMTHQHVDRLNDETLDLKLDQSTGMIAVMKGSQDTEGRAYLNNGYQVVVSMGVATSVIDTEQSSFEPALVLTKAESPGVYHRNAGENQEPRGTAFFAESMPLLVGSKLRSPNGDEIVIIQTTDRVGYGDESERVVQGFLSRPHYGESDAPAAASPSAILAAESAAIDARLATSSATLSADPTEASQFQPTLSKPNVLEFRRPINGLPRTFDLPRALSLASKGFAITGKSWSHGSYFLLEYGKIIMYNSMVPARFVLAPDESLEQETWSIFGLDMDRAAVALGELREGES